MKTPLGSLEITPLEWMSLNQFLHEVKKINSQCVSVYYPYGKGRDTISLLQETKRNKALERIESKIENKIAELRKNPVSVGKFTKTLCIFGWLKDGKVNIKVIGTSKNYHISTWKAKNHSSNHLMIFWRQIMMFY